MPTSGLRSTSWSRTSNTDISESPISSTTLPSAEFTASANLGGVLLGLVISSTLYGMVLLQSYVYFSGSFHPAHGQVSVGRRPKDRWPLRYAVIAICVLDAVNDALNIEMVYKFVTAGIDQVDILTKPTWNFKAVGTVKTCLIWLVQSIYLSRIHLLASGQLNLRKGTSGHGILALYLVSVVLLSCVAGTVFLVAVVQMHSLVSFTHPTIKYLVGVGEALTALVNTIIAITMSYILLTSMTGIGRTDRVLVKLYLYSHAAGVVTSLVSIAGAVLFIVLPNSLAFLALDFSITQVYTLSLLLLLNTRSDLRNELNKPVSINLSAISDNAPASGRPLNKTQTISIQFAEPPGMSSQESTNVSAVLDDEGGGLNAITVHQ